MERTEMIEFLNKEIQLAKEQNKTERAIPVSVLEEIKNELLDIEVIENDEPLWE